MNQAEQKSSLVLLGSSSWLSLVLFRSDEGEAIITNGTRRTKEKQDEPNRTKQNQRTTKQKKGEQKRTRGPCKTRKDEENQENQTNQCNQTEPGIPRKTKMNWLSFVGRLGNDWFYFVFLSKNQENQMRTKENQIEPRRASKNKKMCSGGPGGPFPSHGGTARAVPLRAFNK